MNKPDNTGAVIGVINPIIFITVTDIVGITSSINSDLFPLASHIFYFSFPVFFWTKQVFTSSFSFSKEISDYNIHMWLIT